MVRSVIMALTAVTLAIPAFAGAQQASFAAPSAPAAVAAVTTTTVSPAAVGPRENVAGIQTRDQHETGDITVAPPPRKMHEGESVALMAVGAAGVVTGLIVKGNSGALISLGGAVVGLYGLYLYLR